MADISDDTLMSVVDNCIRELTLGILLQFTRAKILGYFEELEEDEDDENNHIIEEDGLDIFGQPKEVKVEDINCPECHRTVSATRFAPHLEKCMGMGRNSSRLARRRIANVHHPDDDAFDDDDGDSWSNKSKRQKIKRNGSPKLTKKMLGKVKNDLSCSPPVVNSTETEGSDRGTFEALSPQSKEKFLKTMCGVISEYTKKLCTRSLRCPQHSDEQRATARSLLLPISSGLEETGGGSEHNSDSSLSTDTTWAPGSKKKRGKCRAKKGLLLLP